MIEHALVAGVLPADAAEIERKLDAASKDGFSAHTVNLAPMPAPPGSYAAFYVATLVKAVVEEKPSGIRMTGGPQRLSGGPRG